MSDKIKNYSTAELVLRHRQCVEFLSGEKKNIDIKIGPPSIAMMMANDDGRKDRIKEKEAIEFELLHRCQGGDKDACL